MVHPVKPLSCEHEDLNLNLNTQHPPKKLCMPITPGMVGSHKQTQELAGQLA